MPPRDPGTFPPATPYNWPPIPPGDPSETRMGNPSDPNSWHIGMMISQGRAISVARALFPDEETNGSDCKGEIAREGLPCNVCASRNQQWFNRVAEVRRAMIKAF